MCVEKISKNGWKVIAAFAVIFATTCLLIFNPNNLKSFTKQAGSSEIKIKYNGYKKLPNEYVKVPHQRFLPIHANKMQSFVHVSKCAGSAWIKELWKVLGKDHVFPRKVAGQEFSVAFQKKMRPKYETLMISTKNPRAHVWGLWSECVYNDNWNHGHIPYNDSMTDEQNFEIWLEHFLKRSDNNNNSTSVPSSSWKPKASQHYKCYHPSNYQSRHLTVKMKKPNGVDNLPKNEYRLEPHLNRAISTLQKDMGWVAIVDFFPESKCLLYYRITQNDGLRYVKSEKKKDMINDYLDRWCHCDHDDSGKNTNNTADGTIHFSHHEGGHRNTMSDLPSSILEKIDALVRVDTAVYRIALSTFLVEQAWLESMLGRRVLCDQKLKTIQPELDYLGLDLIELYDSELSLRRWSQFSNSTR